jgi:hypothetical protein
MTHKTAHDYKEAIQSSGKDIYTPIEIGDADYWIPAPHLEQLINEGLQGKLLQDAQGRAWPIRTRSKLLKTEICKALGYPIPKSFRKTQPRFLGQQLDAFAQKSMNLQIWNEDLSPIRRYAIIQIAENDTVLKAKIVSGQELALFDKTGTITRKYQARLETRAEALELISALDSAPMLACVNTDMSLSALVSPIDEPEIGALLPIEEIFQRLSRLVGQSFPDPGMDQERNRGAALHRLICECLGYCRYEDNGKFPDVRHQLLEVKLQTSPTIDLGLILPNSEELLDVRQIGEHHPRHCDTRYALFFAKTDGHEVTLTHLFVTVGGDFFTRFRRFEGNIRNGKIQIPLPHDFFGL